MWIYKQQISEIAMERKEKRLIKLFAMVEICLASYIHFGDEQACVNNYIKSLKSNESYYSIWER